MFAASCVCKGRISALILNTFWVVSLKAAKVLSMAYKGSSSPLSYNKNPWSLRTLTISLILLMIPSVLGSTSFTSEITFITFIRSALSFWFSSSAGFLIIPWTVYWMKFLRFFNVVLNWTVKNWVKTLIQARTLLFNEFLSGWREILSQAISIGVLILLISFWMFLRDLIFWSNN